MCSSDLQKVNITSRIGWAYQLVLCILNKEVVWIFDIAMPIGMSFAFNNLVIDARYALGLNTAFKGKLDDYNFNNADLYNSVFSLTLGYRFNLK